MPSDRLTALIIAAVGLLVLTAAAASLADPSVTDGGFGAPGEWFDDGGGGGDSIENGDELDEGSAGLISQDVLCFPFLLETEVQLLLLALAAALGLVVWRLANRWIAVAVLGMVVPMGTVVYLALLGACQIDTENVINETGLAGIVAEQTNATAGQAIETATDPLVVLLLLAAVGLLAIGIVVLRDDTDAGDPPEFAGPELEEESDLDALAMAAGDAADRLEDGDLADADLDNEIYRAWAKMTAPLDVDAPDTTTPGEFAEAAKAAGMDPDDVTALTELFESVRYGGRRPTSERETRAIEVLRRIEADYGEST